MFFQDHEKQIYSPVGSDKKYDPLALDRALMRASDGRLGELVEIWKLGRGESGGDISKEGKRQKELDWRTAEEELVKVARKSFELPEFPDCLDATALEYLCDYLGWMVGKGERGKSPQ